MNSSINIVGGGFAGLTLALQLAKKNFKVHLYEKQNRLGGLIGTVNTPYGLAEQAANGMIATPAAQALFEDLGLKPLAPLPTARNRYIYNNKPTRWPLSKFESIGFFSSIGWRYARNGKMDFLPEKGQTLEAWGLAKIGHAATFKILEPAMQGIYANELKDLSASLILNPLLKKRSHQPKSKYKGQITGAEGMQDLINALETKLRNLGVEIHLNTELNLKNLNTPTVIATSMANCMELLAPVLPEIPEVFTKSQMSSLISVKVFFSETPKTHQGFGVLIPRQQGLRAYGILRNSFIFANRDQTYNETWILGGLRNEDLLQLGDQELLDLILKEREKVFQSNQEPISHVIHRWPQALPVYNVHLEEALRNLKHVNHNKLIYLHGNYLGGLGLSKILERSHTLANQLESVYG